jgi:hypothetical protein
MVFWSFKMGFKIADPGKAFSGTRYIAINPADSDLKSGYTKLIIFMAVSLG